MIKGVGRINLAINLKRGVSYKEQFQKKIRNIDLDKIATGKVDIDLVSLSHAGDFPVQLLSILSFLKNAGIPNNWTIVSDGSYTSEQIQYFKNYSFINIIDWKDFITENYKEFVFKNECWQYKKFFAFASAKIERPTILLDSDVLFLPKFKHYYKVLDTNYNWHLSDITPYHDDEYKFELDQNYLNSGFLLMNHAVNWQPGMDYILDRAKKGLQVTHFTEMTAIIVVSKIEKFKPLDGRIFYTELYDHFTLGTYVKHENLAVRHFPGYIRFRMWIVAKEFNYFS